MKCFSDIRQIRCSLILISHYNHLVLTECAEKYLTKEQQQDNLELCLISKWKDSQPAHKKQSTFRAKLISLIWGVHFSLSSTCISPDCTELRSSSTDTCMCFHGAHPRFVALHGCVLERPIYRDLTLLNSCLSHQIRNLRLWSLDSWLFGIQTSPNEPLTLPCVCI